MKQALQEKIEFENSATRYAEEFFAKGKALREQAISKLEKNEELPLSARSVNITFPVFGFSQATVPSKAFFKKAAEVAEKLLKIDLENQKEKLLQSFNEERDDVLGVLEFKILEDHNSDDQSGLVINYSLDDPVLFRAGDSIEVHTKVREGGKERTQLFRGIIIGVKGRGTNGTFTVRRISYGEGVEKIFPVRSPNIEKVEVVRAGKVRRAKLNYLRGRIGKRAMTVKERK